MHRHARGFRSQRTVNAFVEEAHRAPLLAIERLTRDSGLATLGSSWGETALQAASHLGHRQLIFRLLESGAELDIFAAAALGEAERVIAMLPRHDHAVCGIHNLPLLHFAVVSRDLSTLEALLCQGVSANPPEACLSALHTAVSIASLPMVQLLVGAGADIVFPDAFGATALDWAYELGLRGGETLALLTSNRQRPTGVSVFGERESA
jgi:uncharacterized protein